MGIVTTCTPHKREWRLQVRGKLTKRLQSELRLALYWIDGLPVKEKERLVNGEELRLTVLDAVIGVIQLAAPRVPLDAELLSEAPSCTHTDTIDETTPASVHHIPLHIGAKQTVKEITHATH
jgi:hypothetical protein